MVALLFVGNILVFRKICASNAIFRRAGALLMVNQLISGLFEGYKIKL
ncbi:MAG: hypothetical protein NWS63_09265 [Saprospiraceae bacterium]|jgi:hypothetical protein|nr:hypothetical protein [Saprospiraceae bacterium]MDP4999489.1 hypothetical protein [Saprospiraceae bacterium]